MRIACFDSGIGGLTVLHEAMKRLPHEHFLYYADTLHVPYGTKSKEDVMRHVNEAVAAIVQEEVKALIVACNTATSIAISQLRQTYSIPIIGMEPAVKPALDLNRTTGKRVLVLATPLTLKQSKFKDLIARLDDQSIVDSLPLPELVHYCEQLNFDRSFMSNYFHTKLSSYPLQHVGTVVLGCTHYPFYTNILREILPSHIDIVDGSAGTVSRLVQILEHEGPVSCSLQKDGYDRVDFRCSSQDQAYIHKMETALHILRNQ
ncbi:glutamate racemase [Paenibacillus sp. 481]|uniref:glutamate racemase n=1 Tax=Paenibacillus sp. 481 TaxID=2835869 RepID=UPI001E5453FB|nr:glutamate racemase [Paenibacillus sp. 481]UHA73650.1 glutamate racemase [Paenibacillus sp. 481]